MNDKSQTFETRILTLAGQKGWNRLDRAEMDERTLILRLFLQAAPTIETAETGRDALLDALMMRLEALQPHRAGFRALWWALKGKPRLALSLWPDLTAAMAETLESAGYNAGAMQRRALTGLYVRLMDIWFHDETPDLTQTMAALDKGLSFLERCKVL